MQNNKAEDIERKIIDGFTKVFNNNIKNICVCESTDIPNTMVGIEFEVYRYFNIRFNYDRGAFGCCIINGKYGIALESTEKWFDKANLDKFFQDIKSEIELRIPDKFLDKNV